MRRRQGVIGLNCRFFSCLVLLGTGVFPMTMFSIKTRASAHTQELHAGLRGELCIG